MGRLLKGILGGGAPKVSNESKDSLADDKKSAKRQRRKLLETEGAAAGEELEAGQVRRRDTLLGN